MGYLEEFMHLLWGVVKMDNYQREIRINALEHKLRSESEENELVELYGEDE